MASSDRARSALLILGIAAAGMTVEAAWQQGLWGLLIGSLLAMTWAGALVIAQRPGAPFRIGFTQDAATPDDVASRLLLDIAPVPMVAIDNNGARALNRAARRLFATDDHIRDGPPALLDARSVHANVDARRWRIDRVVLGDPTAGRMVAALVDIEGEEQIAEARAAADMIHVLGHELLNGLAPIASLAESGEALLDRPEPDLLLLRDILDTVARRAEGLRGFAEAYRALARLPEPKLRSVPLSNMLADLSRLFAAEWPGIGLHMTEAPGSWPLDREQIMQAIWALLQNAAEAVGNAGGVRLDAIIHRAGLVFTVTDSGQGISPDEATRIFRPFYTSKPGGTGIGLSLARQIINAHGGSLTCEKTCPTTFRVVLPRKDA